MSMSTLAYFMEFVTSNPSSDIIKPTTNTSFNDRYSSNIISSTTNNLTKHNKTLTRITNHHNHRPISIVPSLTTSSKYYHLYLNEENDNIENLSENQNNNHYKYTTIPSSSTLSSSTTTLPTMLNSVTENLLQQQQQQQNYNYSTSNTTTDTDILISFFGTTTTTSLQSAISLSTSTVTSSFVSSTIDSIISDNNMNNITTTLIKQNDYLNLTWPQGCAVIIFLFLIFITIIGNTLVILSVLTTRRLRTVTNCFVMNLAITDWLVGIFVMPPAVIFYIVGSWKFGWILCDIWISLDVLLCTASILSLCAISLDRYLAVIQPLTYSKKRRSKRLALFMIFIVWIVAFSITCPPFLGWYEPGRQQSETVDCRYNQNKGYVVFSAMGSFFIPLTVMLYVYLNIGYVLTSRRHRINLTEASEKSPENDADCENFLTETEHIIHQCSPQIPYTFNQKQHKSKKNQNDIISTHHEHSDSGNTAVGGCGAGGNNGSTTLYELVEISRSSSLVRCSTISCKYSTAKMTTPTTINLNNISDGCGSNISGEHIPMESIHFNQSRASYSESNLSAAKFKVNHHQQLQQQHHPHNHHQHMNTNPTAIPSGNSITIGKSHRVPPMRISTQKRDTKTAKTLTMVMGGFIICWLPFFTYYILIPFLPRAGVSETLMSFLTWVGWVNCAINPFIYAFYNPDFRTAFWRLTFRRICKKPTNHLKIFKG